MLTFNNEYFIINNGAVVVVCSPLQRLLLINKRDNMKSIYLKEGQRFNKLTIIKLNNIKTLKAKTINNKIYNRNKEYYLCQCDCGNKCIVDKSNLITGHTKSCGCLIKQNKIIGEKNKKHNLSYTKIYSSWLRIKQRCYSPSKKDYKNYKGRGIKVCDEWKSDFMNFYNWALENGYNEKLTIDRIDVNGNYEPCNCRLISMKKQQNNKRNNHIIEYNGEKHNISEWIEKLEMKRSTFYNRLLKYGIDNLDKVFKKELYRKR